MAMPPGSMPEYDLATISDLIDSLSKSEALNEDTIETLYWEFAKFLSERGGFVEDAAHYHRKLLA